MVNVMLLTTILVTLLYVVPMYTAITILKSWSNSYRHSSSLSGEVYDHLYQKSITPVVNIKYMILFVAWWAILITNPKYRLRMTKK